MGYYVNPAKETKETWLEREGKRVTLPLAWEEVPADKLPVILLSNPYFTAAGIAWCERELHEFQSQTWRLIAGYLVDIEKLKEVSDIENAL